MDENTIGKLVQDYNENEELRRKISDILQVRSRQFKLLSDALSGRHQYSEWEQHVLRNITVSESGINVRHYSRDKDLPLDAIEKLAKLVTQLKVVMERKSQMEERLRQAKLDNIIQRN